MATIVKYNPNTDSIQLLEVDGKWFVSHRDEANIPYNKLMGEFNESFEYDWLDDLLQETGNEYTLPYNYKLWEKYKLRIAQYLGVEQVYLTTNLVLNGLGECTDYLFGVFSDSSCVVYTNLFDFNSHQNLLKTKVSKNNTAESESE